jgi:hypothetical protein
MVPAAVLTSNLFNVRRRGGVPWDQADVILTV